MLTTRGRNTKMYPTSGHPILTGLLIKRNSFHSVEYNVTLLHFGDENNTEYTYTRLHVYLVPANIDGGIQMVKFPSFMANVCYELLNQIFLTGKRVHKGSIGYSHVKYPCEYQYRNFLHLYIYAGSDLMDHSDVILFFCLFSYDMNGYDFASCDV